MTERPDEVIDDEEKGRRSASSGAPTNSLMPGQIDWIAHGILLGAGLVILLVFTTLSVNNAKHKLDAPPVKKAATAAPSDLGFCTDGFKSVLRRALDSCGLLTANQRRGCTPGNLKQVAAISDKDFVALFDPLAERAGILLFGQGHEGLTAETKELLEKKWNDARGASVFLVVARASPEGDVETNQALSHKRANSVLFHLQQKFNDPELEQKVGLLWLGEEYAQLAAEYCKWEHAGSGESCTQADINRSAFVSWIDCQL